MNTNYTFSRILLRSVLGQVRAAFPGIDVRKAWVGRVRPGQYEFHFDGFRWHGRADSSDEARVYGWQAYLADKEFDLAAVMVATCEA